jgi:hypothetical protein
VTGASLSSLSRRRFLLTGMATAVSLRAHSQQAAPPVRILFFGNS